jgi:HAD superfamily hydrolase (TIGR01509 family)
MIERYGADFPAQKLREEKNLIFDRHLAQGIPLKPGVTEVLEWLSAHGIPSAAASATIHEKIVDRFTKTDLLKYFTVMVGGDEVTHGKPHPETFLTAAKRLGVDPADCLVFEDSHNGVIAAHEAGMHVIMIPDLVAPTPELLKRVKHELGSLEEALPILINVFEK